MGSYCSDVKPYTLAPKKRLGQHFLRDTGVIDKIVRWIQPRPEDLFLEIGAGDGALSQRLAATAAQLVAIELDFDRIPLLESNLARHDSATVLHADILRLDLSSLVASHLCPQQRLRIAGNLPYNIATAIIEKFLHCGLPVHDMAFMVQAEVAQRITAERGSRQYGYLSVHCQHHSSVQIGFKVPPSCFVPRPKVNSAMVSLKPGTDSRDPEFEADFEAVVKAAFSHRRKTLLNSLGLHPAFSADAKLLLHHAGIDGARRAESLSIAEFEALARVYNARLQSA